MKAFTGKWSYRSFRHEAIAVTAGKLDGNPELAVPWAPPGELEIDHARAGEVTGLLTFAPGVVLRVAGRITPAAGTAPAALEVTGEGLSASYRLKGFFVSDDHVVGTVVCAANDLARQPVGTAGPFVLAKVRR